MVNNSFIKCIHGSCVDSVRINLVLHDFLCFLSILALAHLQPTNLQLLVKLEDNRLIETVGIPVEDEKGSVRLTACVSSQVLSASADQLVNILSCTAG